MTRSPTATAILSPSIRSHSPERHACPDSKLTHTAHSTVLDSYGSLVLWGRGERCGLRRKCGRGRRGRVWRTRRVKGRNMYMMFMSTTSNCKLTVDKCIHKLIASVHRNMKSNITYMYTHMYIYNVHPLYTLHTPHTYKYYM